MKLFMTHSLNIKLLSDGVTDFSVGVGLEIERQNILGKRGQ